MNISISPSGITHVIQGDCVVSAQPDAILSTLLGSCVAACLYDASKGLGGMNHFLLPEAGSIAGDNRYAAAAMELLLNKLLQNGACRSKLQAKLFGGARIVAGLSDIGARNALAAQKFLVEEGIPLLKSDLCGSYARRIRFWPSTGRVQMELLEPTALPKPEVPSRQRKNDIELF